MWLSDRRKFLVGALGGALVLAGCGFTPVYGPQGAAAGLQNAIALPRPDDKSGYLLNRRIEERLGRAGPDAPLSLSYSFKVETQGFGSRSDGSTTRHRLIGNLSYVLRGDTGESLLNGRVTSFTGYSSAVSTVATQAAASDAEERLIVILSDMMIDEILLAAPDLP
ncbi:MAG: hypothetical protein N4A61_14245 [Pelagimonas sp.]|jgi:LPS-assembly lipoprotein|nr:hypothetical protein [Pelagimonas sp.]